MAQNKAKKSLFISAFVSGKTIEAAAAAAGVSRSTATRWLKEDDVRSGISERVAEIETEMRVLLAGKIANSIETLDEISRDKNAPPAARVRAADILIARALDLITAAHSSGALGEDVAYIIEPGDDGNGTLPG